MPGGQGVKSLVQSQTQTGFRDFVEEGYRDRAHPGSHAGRHVSFSEHRCRLECSRREIFEVEVDLLSIQTGWLRRHATVTVTVFGYQSTVPRRDVRSHYLLRDALLPERPFHLEDARPANCPIAGAERAPAPWRTRTCVNDDRTVTGFDFSEMGAVFIGQAFAEEPEFEFLKELRTPLYRVQLFRRTEASGRSRRGATGNPQVTARGDRASGDLHSPRISSGAVARSPMQKRNISMTPSRFPS